MTGDLETHVETNGTTKGTCDGTWDDLGILKKFRTPRTVNPIIVRGNFLYDSVT
jgi:hypothetical protein